MTDVISSVSPEHHSPQPGYAGRMLLLTWLYGLGNIVSLSDSYSRPGLAAELANSQAVFDVSDIAGQAGFLLGALVLGWLADRNGRRPLLLVSLGILFAGALLSALGASLPLHTVAQGVAGIGRGGLLVTALLFVAELSNDKRRAFCLVTVAFAGSFLPMMLGGVVLVWVMSRDSGQWQHPLLAAAMMVLVSLLAAWYWLKEPACWQDRNPIQDNLARQALAHTWPLQVAYSLVVLAEFILIREMLFFFVDGPPSSLGMLLAWISMGGMAGGLLLIALAWRWPLDRLVPVFLIVAGVMYLLVVTDPPVLGTSGYVQSLLAAANNGAVFGLLALVVLALPVACRGIGVGILQGVKVIAQAAVSVIGAWFLGSVIGNFLVLGMMGGACLVAAWLVHSRQGRAGG